MSLETEIKEENHSELNEMQELPESLDEESAQTQSETDSAGEKDGATPGTQSQQRLVPLPALQEERRKRQELQSRLEELERRVSTQQQAAQVQQPRQPQFEWTEDNVLGDLPNAFKTVEQRMLAAMEQRDRKRRYDESEVLARDKYADYDEVINRYAEVAREVPYLATTIDNAPLPAMAAYSAVKKHLEQKKASDPSTQEAEIQRRVQAEVEKLRGVVAAEGVPKSITSARGSGAASPQNTWTGPRSLDDIFGRK